MQSRYLSALAVALLTAACGSGASTGGGSTGGGSNAGPIIHVLGPSMDPTLKDGRFVPTTTLAAGEALARGDIVVYVSPSAPDQLKVSRVLAVPGDSLLIVPAGQPGPDGQSRPKTTLFVGPPGQLLAVSEPYLNPEDWTYGASCCNATGEASASDPQPFTLPAGTYFLMGDNRNHAQDSRIFGPVPRSSLKYRISL